MRRREFTTRLGGAAAWPLVAHAQQAAIPVIGVLGGGSPELWAGRLRAFRQGLSETGYVEGSNVAIEYRWAEGQNDRLPALAADLVRNRIVVMTTQDTPATLAAKAVTTTIPIVFFTAVGRAWVCREPRTARRQPHGRDYIRRGASIETPGTPARAGPHGDHYSSACQPDRACSFRAHHERPANRGPRSRA